jgi:hypothetical protein
MKLGANKKLSLVGVSLTALLTGCRLSRCAGCL